MWQKIVVTFQDKKNKKQCTIFCLIDNLTFNQKINNHVLVDNKIIHEGEGWVKRQSKVINPTKNIRLRTDGS